MEGAGRGPDILGRGPHRRAHEASVPDPQPRTVPVEPSPRTAVGMEVRPLLQSSHPVNQHQHCGSAAWTTAGRGSCACAQTSAAQTHMRAGAPTRDASSLPTYLPADRSHMIRALQTGYYSAIRRNEILTHATTRMGVET